MGHYEPMMITIWVLVLHASRRGKLGLRKCCWSEEMFTYEWGIVHIRE